MNTQDYEIIQNSSFPLPYRVLCLIGLGMLGWAINLHVLESCGVDVISTMALRTETSDVYRFQAFNHSKAIALYRSIYRLYLSYSGFCMASWTLFRLMTRGDPSLVDKYGYIPVITAMAIVFLLLCPFDILIKSEREKFTSAVRRCLFPGPVYFSDVILADIGTSFAKVFGDAWHSLWMLKSGNSISSLPVYDTWLRWILPTMMSIPFFIRFRQCMFEYNSPGNESQKPLYNALKYATSFPVIFLSAAQRLANVSEVKDHSRSEQWSSEHPLFRLWLLAAVVNSSFSFWWDVTNDWGLDLLRFEPSQHNDRQSLNLALAQSATPLLHHDENSISPSETLHAFQTDGLPKRRYRQSCRGLRAVLLYPRAIYPVLIFLNLLLRMTWSVKLSTHVQPLRDGSLAFFWLEVAELVRRWLWVFIRVEWEAIKLGEETISTPLLEDCTDEGDYEMVSEPTSGYRTP